MPLRRLFLLRIGPPAACFRLAIRPSAGAWTAGFDALERTCAETVAFLLAQHPEHRARLLAGEEPPPVALLPLLRDRLGVNDVYGGQSPEGTLDLVVRTSFPIRFWPFGEWVVFDGVHITSDNTSRPFSEDDLNEVW